MRLIDEIDTSVIMKVGVAVIVLAFFLTMIGFFVLMCGVILEDLL